MRTLIDKYLVDQKRSILEGVRYTAIVSTGRTGTKFLGNSFSHIPYVLSIHEPKPVLNDVGRDLTVGKLNSVQVQKRFLNGRQQIIKEAKGNKVNHIIESNGGLTFLLDELNSIIPDFKVIHIIRDPFDMISSGVSRMDNQNEQRYSKDSNWLFKTRDYPNDPNFRNWNSLDIYERFAWIWQFKNQHLSEWCESNENGISVKFEEIFHSGSAWSQILSFLDLEYFDLSNEKKFKNSNEVQFADDRSTWPSARKEKVRALIESLARKFDYKI